jgi:hypothetical protein
MSWCGSRTRVICLTLISEVITTSPSKAHDEIAKLEEQK